MAWFPVLYPDLKRELFPWNGMACESNAVKDDAATRQTEAHNEVKRRITKKVENMMHYLRMKIVIPFIKFILTCVILISVPSLA